MKFGSVDNPEHIDFTLPRDHPGTTRLLSGNTADSPLSVYVGCAKWNRQELKNFYPRGTKDELAYYASRFNAIEFNATFYRNFSRDQIHTWYDKVPGDFRFFPKVHQEISHRKWLANTDDPLHYYISSITHFREKLGTAFLQLRDNFSPRHMDRINTFLEAWPAEVALAVELRHSDWFQDQAIAENLYQLLEEQRTANVIVDTAGRRDLLHMRLTKNETFIRFVGANHPTDYQRLDEWVNRLKDWRDRGLRNIHFFVHQNVEMESPILASYFIRKLNQKLGTDLTIPVPTDNESGISEEKQKDSTDRQAKLF